jgi:hypothetical protein
VKTYILTRGMPRDLDYRYLGPAPQEWWHALRDWTTVERPASMARGSGDEVSLLLTGIPSVRRDLIGRPIRFTLVLEAGKPDAEICESLVRTCLSEQGRESLGNALDDALSAEEIDDLLARRVTADGIDRRVQDAIAKTLAGQEPAAAPAAPVAADQSWAGSLGDPAAESAFGARVGDLAFGQPGFAATLNLVSSIERATAIAEEFRLPVALLLPESVVSGIRLLVGKERAVPRQPPLLDQVLTFGGRSDRTTVQRWITIGAIILSAGALACVIGWLMGRR